MSPMTSATHSNPIVARTCCLASWMLLSGFLGCVPSSQIAPQEGVTRVLIVSLTDSNGTAKQRLEAAIGLVESDEPAAAEALAQILISQPPTQATLAVAEAMAIAQKPPPPQLLMPAIAALNSESPQLRQAAGEALPRFAEGGANSRNIEALLSANRDITQHLSTLGGEADSLARRLAAALRQVFNLTSETPSQQRTELLLGWMSRGETVERELAVRLVSEFIVGTSRPVPPVLIEPLTAMIADPEPAVRLAVAEIFRDLAMDQSADPLLKQLLVETRPNVQAAQAAALGKIGSLASVSPLVSLLQSGEDRPARQAAIALGRLAKRRSAVDGPPGQLQASKRRALAALIDAFESLSNTPDNQIQDIRALQELREAVVDALAGVGDPAALPTLLRAADDVDARVRFAATNGLGQFDTTESVDALTRRLNDPDRGVRLTAATALGQSNQQRVAEIIYQQLKREDAVAVSDALWKELLGQIDGLEEADEVERWVARVEPAARSGRVKALRHSGDVLAIWINRLDKEKDRQTRFDALRKLSEIQLSLDQPLEAAANIHEASALLEDDDQGLRVKLSAERCRALLIGGNVAEVAASVTEELELMTAAQRSKIFEEILAHEQDLLARNAHRQALATVNQLYPAMITLLDGHWRQQMLNVRAEAEKGWQQQLQRQVRLELDKLLKQRARDEETNEAAQNLREMSDEALQEVLKQWLEQLGKGELPPKAELRLMEIVEQWDSRLKGYDASADVDARRETLQQWLRQILPKDDG